VAVTLAETARRVGRLRWMEQRCFEVVGGWVSAVDDAELKACFADHCYHHAWHADVLAARFPDGYGYDLDHATVPGDPALAAWFAALAAPDADGVLLARYGAVLLPAKVAAYGQWLGDLEPAVDGSLHRWLTKILADETADWQAVTVLRSRLERRQETSSSIADQVALHESLRSVAGGVLGKETPA
jgi:hypothetical protein